MHDYFCHISEDVFFIFYYYNSEDGGAFSDFNFPSTQSRLVTQLSRQLTKRKKVFMSFMQVMTLGRFYSCKAG